MSTPSPALASVARLRRLATALDDGERPDSGDGAWLASRLRRYLAGAERGLSVEMALDLAPMPGGQTWFEQERRVQRDSLLHDIAVQHFADLAPGPAAKKIMVAWRRYGRNRQVTDRRRGESSSAPDTIDAALFQLTRLGGPPEQRRVRDILADVERTDAA